MNNTHTKPFYEKQLSDFIIKCAYEVYRFLGPGYLEKVYENSLVEEMTLMGIEDIRTQVPVDVFYKGKCVGDYFADIIIGNKIIIELKAIAEMTNKNYAQILNYLKATDTKVGYVINFGNELNLQYKRFVL